MYFFILALFFVSITSPAFAADMRYPAGEEPLELPAHSALNAQLSRSAQNQEDKKLGAMSLYLTLMREDGRNVWAPYQLAVSSAEKGQTELAERYLQLSADRGLWYYYNLLEDDAFNSIQHSATYQSILAATKARYLQHARHYEGKASYAMPDGEAPPEGWPTVIFLHTYGKAAAINPKNGCCSAKWAWRTSRSTARRCCRKTASAGRITATRAPTPPFSVRCNSWLPS